MQKDITRIDEILMFMEEIAVGDPKDALTPPPVDDPAQATNPDAALSATGGDPAAATVKSATQALNTGPNQYGFLNGYR